MRHVHRFSALVPCGWYGRPRAFSTVPLLRKGADPLDSLFEEMENCDTSVHSDNRETSAKLECNEPSPVVTSSLLPTSDARLRLEEAKHRRLQRQLKDVGEELNELLNEKGRAAAQESSKVYVPSRAGKTFLSSAELIQEKSPQEFVADEKNAEKLSRLPSLQHSGCSAVITMVGVVMGAPHEVSIVIPGDSTKSTCVEFSVRYEIPFVVARTSTVITVRAVGATLSTFARENVCAGDVVHILGHLAPFDTPGESNSLCAVYVLPAGGNISVVLSKAEN
jgi:ElaB/YqjD/DUF883 family membrane-anchored ribosome-binding protein